MTSSSETKAVEADDTWAFGSGGYCRIFGERLAQSSLLEADVSARWLFLFILSQADAQGRYRCASIAGLARAAALTLRQARKAIAQLEAPDPSSTTPDAEGRRLLRIPGGWRVVSYSRYREFRTRKQVAAAEKKRRQRRAAGGHVPHVPGTSPTVPPHTSDVRRQIPDTREPPAAAPAAAAALDDLAAEVAGLEERATGRATTAEAVMRAASRTGQGRAFGRAADASPAWVRATTDRLLGRRAELQAQGQRAGPEHAPEEVPPESRPAAAKAWGGLLDILGTTVPRQSWATWFRPTEGWALVGGVLTVGVPSVEHARWLAGNFAPAVDHALRQAGLAVRVEYHVVRRGAA